jgi:dihydroorotate dehydrogenase
VTRDGAPALGLDRPTSGVCGAPIRAAALAFVAAARAAIDAGRLGLALVGVGGVAAPEHVDAMLAAGADVVQSATGIMWHPGLAAEYHEQQQRRAAARPGRPAGAA